MKAVNVAIAVVFVALTARVLVVWVIRPNRAMRHEARTTATTNLVADLRTAATEPRHADRAGVARQKGTP